MKNLLIIIAIAFFTSCGGGGGSSTTFDNKLPDNNQKTSPKGAKVFSNSEISIVKLDEIDKGLDELFRIARQYKYTVGLNHSNYRIYLFPRSPKCVNPAFLMEYNGTQYDGSEWDKDPRPGKVALCAAGKVHNETNFQMIVVDDVPTLPTITRFEGEHIIYFHNDQSKYWATQYHQNGNGHPIMPDIDIEGQTETPSFTKSDGSQLSLTK